MLIVFTMLAGGTAAVVLRDAFGPRNSGDGQASVLGL
jgi:hypothetical protein